MKTGINLWYLTEFFLESEIFEAKVVPKIKTHISDFKNIAENHAFFMRQFGKYGRDWQVTGDNIIWRTRIACLITKATDTNTHIESVILISFALKQWLRESDSILRNTFIVLLINVSISAWNTRKVLQTLVGLSCMVLQKSTSRPGSPAHLCRYAVCRTLHRYLPVSVWQLQAKKIHVTNSMLTSDKTS